MRLSFAPIAALVFAASLPAAAQQLETPRPSPNAKTVQTVGITDITVDYSSPAVGGRTIWGGLQKFGEVWRAGANATTKITFSKDVTVGSTPIPAGSYAFFVIPNQSGPWTLILNKDYLQGGAFNYKKELDVVRVDAAPETIPNRERLAYIVANFTADQANIDLEWEKVRVSLPVKLNTDAQVMAGIKAVENGAWSPYNDVANYERQIKHDNATALTYAEKSMKVKSTWQNLWTMAQILAAEGKYKDAVTAVKTAIKLGGDTAPQFFKDSSAASLAEWKAK